MEQPNATGDGDAALTPRVWVLVVATGVATGLFGAFLMWVLFGMQHLAFGDHNDQLVAAVERSSNLRRVLSLTVAGVFGAIAWFLVRKFMPRQGTRVDDVVWNGGGELGFPRSFATSVIQEVVIGLGASIGREAAPKLMGGVSGSLLGRWAGLTPSQRRLLIACGGGAGLTAVYNVPLAGALFTTEILLGSLTVPTVLPAVACSWIATVVSWLYLPDRATYLNIPAYHVSASLVTWAILVGPVVGLISVAFIRLVGWVSYRQLQGKAMLVAFPIALCALGFLGIQYPQLFGNGKDMAHAAFLGQGGLLLLFALFALKPLVTTMCLGAGGSGGLLTPTLSTGAALGGFLGAAWTLLWPGSPVGAYAMVAAAAMMGASLQAPLTALALVLELTHAGFGIMVPMALAVVTATAVARYMDGYSIYSARLEAR